MPESIQSEWERTLFGEVRELRQEIGSLRERVGDLRVEVASINKGRETEKGFESKGFTVKLALFMSAVGFGQAVIIWALGRMFK